MTAVEDHTTTTHDEIAHLAYLNWRKDGSPHGHDHKYWIEAERQIKATKHLLVREIKPPSHETSAAEKSRPKKTRKKSASQSSVS